MIIYIKNMPCESRKVVVKEALKELDISPIKVEPGEIETKENISDVEKKELCQENDYDEFIHIPLIR